MSLADVSCLIPLYKSEKHLRYVLENIDEHIARGANVVVSDQHGLDRTVDQLRDRYRDDPRVTVLASTSGGDWVDNVNVLIASTRTPFFRIIPHDDSVTGHDTELLAETLRSRPGSVLCHGYVRAETADGSRLAGRDEPGFPLNPWSTRSEFSMALFWQGLFNGAFKSLIRTQMLPTGPLAIRPTKDLVHAERAWLFGLSLLGDFTFDERAMMTKRYWTGSVSDQWRPDATHTMSTAAVMASYIDDLVDDAVLGRMMRFNCYLNAVEQAAWLDGQAFRCPEFDPIVPSSR